MLRYTIYVIAVLCIIREIHGRPQQNPTKPSPVQEAVQKINPELDKITLRLKELKLIIHKSLLRSHTEAHELISKFGNKMLVAINQLQANTSEIADISDKSNINIESCLCRQRAKLERVVMVANSKTKKTSEEIQMRANNFTEKANKLVQEVDDIDKNINKIIGYCIRQNNLAWQQEKLAECLFNEASYVNKKVDELYKQQNLIDSERNNLANNITADQNNLLKWITTLQEETLKCVSDSIESQEVLSNQDSNTLRKPAKEEMPHQYSTETNKTVVVNLDQQIKTGYQFEQPHRIFNRIRKLEFLLDLLKQLRQFEDMENKEKTSPFPKEDEFDLNKPVISPNAMEFGENTPTPTAERNRRFILYISF